MTVGGQWFLHLAERHRNGARRVQARGTKDHLLLAGDQFELLEERRLKDLVKKLLNSSASQWSRM